MIPLELVPPLLGFHASFVIYQDLQTVGGELSRGSGPKRAGMLATREREAKRAGGVWRDWRAAGGCLASPHHDERKPKSPRNVAAVHKGKGADLTHLSLVVALHVQ